MAHRNGLPVIIDRDARKLPRLRAQRPKRPRRECGVGRRESAKAGDQSLSNGPGTPQNLFCGAFVHFPPAESGQKGRRGAFIPRAKCPPEPPVRALRGRFLLHPSPASAAGLRFAPAGGRETKDEGGKPGGGKISENRRLTRNGKTDILRPLPNRSQPEGGAQDDQRKHGLVRIGRKEAWTEGALRTHAALRSKTAFFARSLSFCRTGSAFFAPFRRSLLFCKEDIVSWNRKPSSRPGKRPR